MPPSHLPAIQVLLRTPAPSGIRRGFHAGSSCPGTTPSSTRAVFVRTTHQSAGGRPIIQDAPIRHDRNRTVVRPATLMLPLQLAPVLGKIAGIICRAWRRFRGIRPPGRAGFHWEQRHSAQDPAFSDISRNCFAAAAQGHDWARDSGVDFSPDSWTTPPHPSRSGQELRRLWRRPTGPESRRNPAHRMDARLRVELGRRTSQPAAARGANPASDAHRIRRKRTGFSMNEVAHSAFTGAQSGDCRLPAHSFQGI